MKRIILIDGNNLMFRSYYATAYNGTLMKTSKGMPVNALYGFVTMLNKIIEEEKPTHMLVAFDIGKSFRHKKYAEYKAGRSETPNELLQQFERVNELLDAMGIKHLAVNNYEADDIIGTISKKVLEDDDFYGTIISSDKDLLQLINQEVDVKLLKPKDYIRYNETKFKEDYGFMPIKMIDLKALMGDASDNIMGVKGIGEKTAIKLLQSYGSLESIYENIENIKGATHDKLINGKNDAFFSKELCTIYRDVPINMTIEEMTYLRANDKLVPLYQEFEFYSFLKNMDINSSTKETKYQTLTNINELNLQNKIAYYIECDKENYHDANILGAGIYDGDNLYYVPKEMVKETISYISKTTTWTYDLKKNMYLLKDFTLNTSFDTYIALYLLNYQVKDDIAVIMNKEGVYLPFYNEIIKDESKIKSALVLKAKYIYDTHEKLYQELINDEMLELFKEVEMPLIKVLAKMEYNGVICNKDILNYQKTNVENELKEMAEHIYEFCHEEFNILSPKQLGEVLFEHLHLPYNGKLSPSKRYSTDSTTIMKLANTYPALAEIIDYRNLSKLNSTYLEGLTAFIKEDGKIHTTYNQALTRTGRLSSMDPNMQNIPTRNERGKLVRKAFLPANDLFICADYSQIELRILAHISDSKELIEAFINDEDIHTSVASDIFEVEQDKVTKEMRRTSKAVVFGIVYGISGFGLGENLKMSAKESKKLIDKFYELYPGVKLYMDETIKDAHENLFVRTLYHRKRIIEELANKNYIIRQAGERVAMNTPIQGTGADILKMAMIKIDDIMSKNKMKSKMIMQVHDELIFDAVKEEEAELCHIIKDVMENIVTLKVPLKVNIDKGTDWYEAK